MPEDRRFRGLDLLVRHLDGAVVRACGTRAGRTSPRLDLSRRVVGVDIDVLVPIFS